MASVAYEELLERDGRVITHVAGNSMLPLLLDRQSIVLVEDVRRVPPRRGDVVLYRTGGGTYILHRVLRAGPEEYLIRGDNTRMPEHVPKTTVLATMTGFYRRPDSRFISRTDAACRLYRLALPGIRWFRRGRNVLKRAIRRSDRSDPMRRSARRR